MPYIEWKRLPKGVRAHLEDRLKDRSITEDDMIRLTHWVKPTRRSRMAIGVRTSAPLSWLAPVRFRRHFS